MLIAACDTFRSGAVEQLKTHCGRLGVPLYERGYERDPAKVAAEAVKAAARDGIDVVLVDTAGGLKCPASHSVADSPRYASAEVAQLPRHPSPSQFLVGGLTSCVQAGDQWSLLCVDT